MNRSDTTGFGFSLLGTAGLPHVIFDIVENSPAAESGKVNTYAGGIDPPTRVLPDPTFLQYPIAAILLFYDDYSTRLLLIAPSLKRLACLLACFIFMIGTQTSRRLVLILFLYQLTRLTCIVACFFYFYFRHGFDIRIRSCYFLRKMILNYLFLYNNSKYLNCFLHYLTSTKSRSLLLYFWWRIHLVG